MKRLALACVALLAAWPATAQVVTVPVQSMWQGLTSGVTLSTTVSIYGYTTKQKIPQILQTVNLGSTSPLQSELRAEFPGLKDAGMTVMQLNVKSNAVGATFSSHVTTVTPKQPLAVNVPAGQKLWVVYYAPVGAQGELRFYVGSPPPPSTTTSTSTSTSTATTTSTSTTTTGTSWKAADGSTWTLGAPESACEGGAGPYTFKKNGVAVGTGDELRLCAGVIYGRDVSIWYRSGNSPACGGGTWANATPPC